MGISQEECGYYRKIGGFNQSRNGFIPLKALWMYHRRNVAILQKECRYDIHVGAMLVYH